VEQNLVTITIGISTKDNNQIFENILHEVKEIIHCEQATRFNSLDRDSEYIFVYNHAQHTDLCARLSGILLKFII